ncbi:MAG: alpha/beta hydrolase [Pseudomonadota bacterium]
MKPAVPLPPGALPWDDGFEVVASDGVRLRAARWDGEGPEIALLLSGRTEFLEKMAIPATALLSRGFTVVSVDWRGQGLSQRVGEPAIMGHVGEFADYQQDLAALLDASEVGTGKMVDLMLAHSMGGAIGLGAIYDGVVEPRAVVLSAPMLGVHMSQPLKVAGVITTRLAELFGQLDKRPPFGNVDKPYVFEGFENNVLTSDEEVFSWMVEALHAEPRLQLAMPSLRWLDEATHEMERLSRKGPIKPPTLLVHGTEEAVVEVDEIEKARRRLGCEVVKIDGARHEVLIEQKPMRDAAWSAIDNFLENAGLRVSS